MTSAHGSPDFCAERKKVSVPHAVVSVMFGSIALTAGQPATAKCHLVSTRASDDKMIGSSC